jgi:hypothetical protein
MYCTSQGQYLKKLNHLAQENSGLGAAMITLDINGYQVAYRDTNSGVNIYDYELIGDSLDYQFVKHITHPTSSAFFPREIFLHDTILFATSLTPNETRVYYKDQGGLNNWGFVKSLPICKIAAITQDTILFLGNPSDNTHGNFAGNITMHYMNYGGPNNWGKVKSVIPSNLANQDAYGEFLTVKDTILVGTPNPNNGRLAVFNQNEGGPNNWGEVKLIPHFISGSNQNRRMWLRDTLLYATNTSTISVYEMNKGGTNNWGKDTVIDMPGINNGNKILNKFCLFQDTSFYIPTYLIGCNGDSTIDGIRFFSENTGGSGNWGLINDNCMDSSSIRPLDLLYDEVNDILFSVISGNNHKYLTPYKDTAKNIQLSFQSIKTLNSKVFPNPSSDIIRLHGINGIDKITIYNQVGKVVLEPKLVDTNPIDVSNLNSGTYFVKIVSRGQVITEKIIKLD